MQMKANKAFLYYLDCLSQIMYTRYYRLYAIYYCEVRI